jgi:hypothetical protein
MAARYQHVTDPIRQDIAKRVGGPTWRSADPPEGEEDGGAGTVRMPLKPT